MRCWKAQANCWMLQKNTEIAYNLQRVPNGTLFFCKKCLIWLTFLSKSDKIPLHKAQKRRSKRFVACQESPWLVERGEGESVEYTVELAPEPLFRKAQ